VHTVRFNKKAKGSASFLKKKKQKTFAILRRAGDTASGSDSKKFFGSFFQKRTAFLLCVEKVVDAGMRRHDEVARWRF
jgi:hypothetical protein